MPRKTWNTQADWDARPHGVSCRIRDPQHPLFGQRVGYGRVWAQRFKGPYDDNLTEFNDMRDGILGAFPIQTTDRILIAGCGFGFLVEAFHDAGFTETFGLDSSDHIDSNRATETRGDVIFIKDDMRGGGRVLAAFRRETGDDIFDWIISQLVLESYEDAEMTDLLDAAEVVLNPSQPTTNIIHAVMCVLDPSRPDRSIDPLYNQKTLAEWKAIRPTHSFLCYPTWEVG